MEVSIQAVSPELGVQFSSVLASHAGGAGSAGAAAAGAAGAGAAVCASADTAGRATNAKRTSTAAARRQTEPILPIVIRTLLSPIAGRPRLPVESGRADRH